MVNISCDFICDKIEKNYSIRIKIDEGTWFTYPHRKKEIAAKEAHKFLKDLRDTLGKKMKELEKIYKSNKDEKSVV